LCLNCTNKIPMLMCALAAGNDVLKRHVNPVGRYLMPLENSSWDSELTFSLSNASYPGNLHIDCAGLRELVAEGLVSISTIRGSVRVCECASARVCGIWVCACARA